MILDELKVMAPQLSRRNKMEDNPLICSLW